MQHNDIPTLKQAALSNLSEVIVGLYPDRHIEISRREVRVGNYGSLCIDRRDGKYFDHESGCGGDLINLVQAVLATDFKGAIAWLESYLGNHPVSIQPCNSLRVHKNSHNNTHRINKARYIWQQTSPLCESTSLTIAERYIFIERDIGLSALPADIRCHYELYHYQSDEVFPALVSAIRDKANFVTGVQSIFLDHETAEKADILPPKLCTGIVKGSAIKLGNHDGSDFRLAICEGLEDALSVMELTGWPAWAVCGAYNYRHQQIPESIREIVIAADNDEAGLSAARLLAQRLLNEGRTVSIKPPPDGCKDWNDYLKKKKADARTPATIQKD